MKLKNVVALLLPLLLSLSLAGCGLFSKPEPPSVVQETRRPSPSPELMVPPESRSYSDDVQQELSTWRGSLTSSQPK